MIENDFFLKIHSNLLEGFRVNLKRFMGWAMPAKLLQRQCKTGFEVGRKPIIPTM